MTKLTSKVRNDISAGMFAFAAQRKVPLENASHVRIAIARFNQVDGVSDADRDAAWVRIHTAAQSYGVEIHETSWRQLGVTSPRRRPAR